VSKTSPPVTLPRFRSKRTPGFKVRRGAIRQVSWTKPDTRSLVAFTS
jgi:hypothetical protein